MTSLKQRAIAAAIRYLEGVKHYEGVHEFDGYIVAKDDGATVICRVGMREGRFDPIDRKDYRGQMEAEMLKYLAEFGADEGAIRFDDIQLIRIGDDMAYLRHEENCLG